MRVYAISLVGIIIQFALLSILVLTKANAQDDGLDHLRQNIPGEPGKDYPIHGPSILCKLNPRQCGNQGGSGNGGQKKGGDENKGNQMGRHLNGNGKPKVSNMASNSEDKWTNGQNGQSQEQMPTSNQGKNGNTKSGGKQNSNANSGEGDSGDELDALRRNIPGEPGKDYPIHGPSILCKLNPRQCGGGK